jgi:hypothetical protein
MKLAYIRSIFTLHSHRQKPTGLGGKVRTVRKFEILEDCALLSLRFAGNHAGKLTVILQQVVSQSSENHICAPYVLQSIFHAYLHPLVENSLVGLEDSPQVHHLILRLL